MKHLSEVWANQAHCWLLLELVHWIPGSLHLDIVKMPGPPLDLSMGIPTLGAVFHILATCSHGTLDHSIGLASPLSSCSDYKASNRLLRCWSGSCILEEPLGALGTAWTSLFPFLSPYPSWKSSSELVVYVLSSSLRLRKALIQSCEQTWPA